MPALFGRTEATSNLIPFRGASADATTPVAAALAADGAVVVVPACAAALTAAGVLAV